MVKAVVKNGGVFISPAHVIPPGAKLSAARKPVAQVDEWRTPRLLGHDRPALPGQRQAAGGRPGRDDQVDGFAARLDRDAARQDAEEICIRDV